MAGKYEKLALDKNWKKLAKLGQKKNVEDAVAAAEACASGSSEEARNILTDILARPEREAKVAAVKAMGALHYDPDSQIERLRHVATEGDPELAQLVKEAIEALRSYTRDKRA